MRDGMVHRDYLVSRVTRRRASPAEGMRSEWDEYQIRHTGKHNRVRVLHRTDTLFQALAWIDWQHGGPRP
jgi:hypothetical protein